jgi:hypothetical protein
VRTSVQTSVLQKKQKETNNNKKQLDMAGLTIIPALRKQKHEDTLFMVSLGYTVRPSLIGENNNSKENRSRSHWACFKSTVEMCGCPVAAVLNSTDLADAQNKPR